MKELKCMRKGEPPGIMKTIKQIADELNVSKQAVYKRYKGKLYTEVHPYTHTDKGIVYIDEHGENIIKKDFLKDRPGTTGADTEHIQGYGGADKEYMPTQIFDTLNKTIELLQNQLKEKDKQIEELHNIINTNQHLQAGTIQRLTAPKKEEPGADAVEVSEPGQTEKKKKGIFNIFKRKRKREAQENE